MDNTQQKLVVLVDSGIPADTDEFDEHAEMSHFIKSAQNPTLSQGALIGESNGTKVAYPDFLHPETSDYWSTKVLELQKASFFDGVYLSNNEITTHCPDKKSECPVGAPDTDQELTRDRRHFETSIDYDKLPFNPQMEKPLGMGTISLDGLHYFNEEDDQSNQTNIEFNIHSLYGLYQSQVTFEALKAASKAAGKEVRPFILSRASFPGLGKYSGHWLANTENSWAGMRSSISGMMEMNMFGTFSY